MNINTHMSPCKSCTDRYSACWGSCEKYRVWKAEIDRINDKRKKEFEKSQILPYNKKFN